MADWGKRCARRLIELGVPLALGTGGGHDGRARWTMLDALRFACGKLGLIVGRGADRHDGQRRHSPAAWATTSGRWSRASGPTW